MIDFCIDLKGLLLRLYCAHQNFCENQSVAYVLTISVYVSNAGFFVSQEGSIS